MFQLPRVTATGTAIGTGPGNMRIIQPWGWLVLLLQALVGLQVFATDDGGDWSQWRGPNRDGFVASSQWPSSISETSLVEAWRVPLGESYSGPLIVGDRVFVTETVDKKYEGVRALDRGTGKEIWQAQWEGSMSVPFFAASNGSWIRSTPAYSQGKLYVGGIRDVLVCLDAATGQEVWKIDFVNQHKSELPAFGFVCSPLIDDDFLYVQAGGACVKIEKQTGKIVWRALDDGGGMNGSAFSSPTIATLGGVRQLLVQTRTVLAGVDLQSGDKLWSYEIPAFRGMNIVTPTIFGSAVFTTSYGGQSMLLDVSQENGAWQVKPRWTQKSEGYMSSPIIVDHYVFFHMRNQRCTCLDLNDGQIKWTSTPFGKYWSLVANSDRMLALDQRGELLMLRANADKFELVERRKLTDQQTWAHLAVAGNDVAVRELNAVVFYKWKN